MNETNKWRKISMILGGVIALALVVFNVYHAVKAGELVSELGTTVILAIIFLLPAVALLVRKNTGIILTKVGILYPIIVGIGFINILVSEDPLAAGLPMVLIAAPFCIIYGLIVLIKKN